MRLYPKFIGWAALNIVWLGVVLVAVLVWLFLGAGGRFPHTLFQGGINEAMQMMAVNLQYKPAWQWTQLLEGYSRPYGMSFMVYSLDTGDRLYGTTEFPQKVLETAQQIPRPQVSLCLDPLEAAQLSSDEQVEAESGLLPSQNVILVKAEGYYWYARPAVIPDDEHNPRYVLLAAVSSSVNGNGLFFHIGLPLTIVGVSLLLSFLWWWPFVLHITRPVANITRTAERIASGDYTLADRQGDGNPLFSLTRTDEIGRLASAVDSMSMQLMRQMFGQRRFIRHIAHELGAPLARAKFGLAVLEARLEGDNARRTVQVSEEVERVTALVEDVLAYLRAEGLPSHPNFEVFELGTALEELAEVESGSACVELMLPDEPLYVRVDPECLQRAVGNVLRNAVRYTAQDGPIMLRAELAGDEIKISICDSGPGVPPGEIIHLTEPFFRGETSQSHPGGSGLGLSIVKYCVESCHGRLAFHNREPRGFCVELYFPRVKMNRS